MAMEDGTESHVEWDVSWMDMFQSFYTRASSFMLKRMRKNCLQVQPLFNRVDPLYSSHAMPSHRLSNPD
jgi:hypothetical protein